MEKQTPSPRLALRSDEDDLRVLAAACDMAVLRALELIGKRVARDGRSRYGAMQRSGKDWHEAHTIWRAQPHQVDAALAGAWTTVGRMAAQHGCCALVEPRLAAVLDGYVRGLVASGRGHEFADLERALRDAVA